MRLVGSLGKKCFKQMKAYGQDRCIIYPSPPQASQAAQEAEINARKAKNSVSSLLNLINSLLEQLGE